MTSDFERSRQEVTDWAYVWTKEIVRNVSGGVDYYSACMINMVLHEMRRKLLAGDLGPPRSQTLPMNRPKPQRDMFSEATP